MCVSIFAKRADALNMDAFSALLLVAAVAMLSFFPVNWMRLDVQQKNATTKRPKRD
jgi:hypothetical protein